MMTDVWQKHLSREYFAEFKDRGVIVAGGGQGIGAALVGAFHWLGARVVILDKNTKDADKIAAACIGGNAPIVIQNADLADEQMRGNAIKAACDAIGDVRIFVSTIGLDTRIALPDLGQDDMERMMHINFQAPFFSARDIMPVLRQSGGGNICLFTSRHGSEISEPDMSGYGCAKAALDSGIKRLAIHAGNGNTPQNIIRVFGFCPGWVQTDNQKARFSDDQLNAGVQEQLVPTATSSVDVAAAVIFNLSRHAGILSGTTLRYDSGDGQLQNSAVKNGSKAA